MPITSTQLERRKKHIGSSDMAALLGLSPYTTPYDVWADKTGRLPEDEGNAATKAGQYFESGVLEYAEEKLGNIIRNQYRSVKDQGIPIAANIDALVVQTGEPIEAKTVGLLGFSNELWGDSDTDEVPDLVIVQAHVHLLCTEQELCHIAAFIAGRGFVPYRVRRDEEVISVIKETAVKFWNDFVLPDVPPDGSLPTAKVVAKMRRQPNMVATIDPALYRRNLRLRAIEKKIKDKAEAAKTELLASLGDAEAGECEHGSLTYFTQTRKEYTVKESTFRVARFKENK
jgi:putative phage-type endonuclease